MLAFHKHMAHFFPLRRWVLLSITTLIPIIVSSQSSTYIVHMDVSAKPTAFPDHRSWFSSTLSTFEDVGVDPELLYVYENAIHGFTARLTPTQLEQLEKSYGYLHSYEDVRVKADTTHSTEFLHLNSDTGIWPASNYGAGVVVGVVDTGLWPESPSYNDDGMAKIPARWRGACDGGTSFDVKLCNKKLIGVRYFNKGLVAANPNITIVNSTRDTDGHGTHTSSTVAGNYVVGAEFFGYAPGTARGVAPRAHLAMYKVLWEEGGYVSDVIAGIDAAISDGVDVLSISLGIDYIALHADPIAIAAFAAMEKGIFVATSTGNSGPFLRSLHNGIPWTLTVGASTIDRQFAGVVTLGDRSSIVGTSLYISHSQHSTDLPLVLVESCVNNTVLRKYVDKIVVCTNIKSLGEAVQTVEEAKVAGAVFISEDPNSSLYEVFVFPGVIVSRKEGEVLEKYIKENMNPVASLEFKMTILGVKPSPTVAYYTSRGPSPSSPSVLKPDLVAPGSMILASWSPNSSVAIVGSRPVYNQFNVISGSSMSCPHAAGVAALIRAAHPNWSPAAVRSAMMTTTDIVDNTGNPIMDNGSGATPLAMGSGHVNPNKALNPGLVYDAGVEDYMTLLCAMNFTRKQISSVTRSSNFNCSTSSLDLNYPSFIAFFEKTNTSSSSSSEPLPPRESLTHEFRRTLTNMEEGNWTYVAEVTPIEVFNFNISVVPNTLHFGGIHEKQSFVVKIEGSMGNQKVMHGALTWTDEEGKHVVRSPIVATTLSSQPL